MNLFIDTETFCETPISYGTFAYVDNVETMLIPYAIDEQPAVVWDLTSTALMPDDLKAALSNPAVSVVMHNSQFDRNVLKRSPGVDIPLSRIHDTMARARAHSLPGGLGKLCEVLNIPVDQAKDKEGRNYIQRFCKPLAKNSKLRRATRLTHPKEWAAFVDYARLDVEATRAVYKKLPMWNFTGFEHNFWKTDTVINERGVAVDLDFVRAAIRATEETKNNLSRRTAEATDDYVQKTTQRDRLLEYIHITYDIKFDDLTASMVEKALNDEALPNALKELLLMRSEASLSSTAKYKKFLNAVSPDGRLRGMFVYCGASRTGRAAGNVVQLHNLPRQMMEADDIEIGIAAMKLDAADFLFDNVMSLASNAVRGCLVPAKGKKFVIADLSNIEGRVCAWLAGEKWKLKAFADFDKGIGPDLYKVAYAKPFHISPDAVDKYQRAIGKVMELMLQYSGGCGAFVTGAKAYGIDLDDLADRAWDSIPGDVMDEAKNMWAWAVKEKRTLELSQRAFIVCDALKRMWRRAHPMIEAFWSNVSGAVLDAVETANNDYKVGLVTVRRDNAWTRIVLPSGRCLCYPSTRVDKDGLSYSGVNPYSRQWGRVRTYGGKLVENIVQATARDVLVAGVMNAEKAGYPVVVHVHDEIVAEVPDTPEYTAEGLSKLMTEGIAWAKGLPLAAAGFESYRYRKG